MATQNYIHLKFLAPQKNRNTAFAYAQNFSNPQKNFFRVGLICRADNELFMACLLVTLWATGSLLQKQKMSGSVIEDEIARMVRFLFELHAVDWYDTFKYYNNYFWSILAFFQILKLWCIL